MGKRLLVYPGFDDIAALTDRYWRLVHYLGPAVAGIEALYINSTLRPASRPPAYLDQTLPEREASLRERVLYDAAKPMDADIIIVWDARYANDSAIRSCRRVVIDPATLHEGDLGIELGAELRPRTQQQRSSAQRRLLSHIANAKTEIAHVFGTGPRLAMVDVDALAPGASIVCNSLVKNDAFLDALRPAFVVAVDPIFHAGPSAHAAAFRARLACTLARLRPLFVVQERDAHIYEATLPQPLHDLLTPIPVGYGLKPNLDLADRFEVTATRNVLTMALLPLAAMLGRDVRIYGCDGRAPGERATFWAYDPRAAFPHEQAQQHEAHPGFFSLDVGDYYALHCETVRLWLRAMEQRGLRVTSGTPSFIPALAARPGSGVALSATESLRSQMRGRAAFAYRAMQSMYGAALRSDVTPLWFKRILRAAVRNFRGSS